MDLRKISDQLSVAPQITPAELAQAKALGFKSVINNRPNGEELGQPTAEEVAAIAAELGLAYVHQPVISGQITDDDIRAFKENISAADTPVLAFCRTGTRCTILWALARANGADIDETINAAAAAGYDISGQRPRMEALASGD